MSNIEAKQKAKAEFGERAYISSHRGGHAGYHPRVMVRVVGIFVGKKSPKPLGYGTTWEEALDRARARVENDHRQSE